MKSSLVPYNAPQGFDWIISYDRWRITDHTLAIAAITNRDEQVDVLIEEINNNVWRYRVIPFRSSLPAPTGMVVGHPKTQSSLNVTEDERGICVKGNLLTLKIDRSPWALHVLNKRGKTVLRENPSDVDGLGRLFILPLGYMKKQQTVSAMTTSFHLAQDEHIFGLGEKFTPLDKRQQKIVTWTQDAFGSTSERSHKNIPFLWSTKGYGLFLNSGARMTWDIGTSSCQTYTVTAEDTSLDMFLLYGPSPAEILQHYADLTGHAALPPAWTFGLWMSSGGTYRDRKSIEALIAQIERHRLPADVVHIDPWWMQWRKYCDFQWNEEAFPGMQDFIDSIHEKGLRICLWEHPYLSIESALYAIGLEKNYFVKKPDGCVYIIDYGLSLAPRPDGMVRTVTPENSWNAPVAIVDLTNPEAYRWFQDLHRPLLRAGIDVFKTDFGEDIPIDAVFASGQTGRTMHNLYPLLYNQAVFEVTKEERGDGIIWGRSGTAGSQRFPVCWSGDPAADFDSLACTIRGGLSAGMSGIPFWSNDIGGYRGMPSEKLYIRWAQFGLFCSHSRMHGDSPREPWIFSKKAERIVKKFAELRYQLFPYLYSSACEAVETNLPMMRALALVYPNDPNVYDKDLEFMLGPSLLVAPVYDESDRRSVYVPVGTWVDYWTREEYTGPTTIIKNAPLSVLPLFVKKGAIIPMMKKAMKVPENGFCDTMQLNIYPDRKGTYSLRGKTGRTKLSYTLSGDVLSINVVDNANRTLEYCIHSANRKIHIVLSVNGKKKKAKTAKREGIIILR